MTKRAPGRAHLHEEFDGRVDAAPSADREHLFVGVDGDFRETCVGQDAPQSIGIGRIESPRGETVCVIETSDGTLRRLHLRTGSYANWPALAHTVPGNLLPDFPLINKSFELCYACADR